MGVVAQMLTALPCSRITGPVALNYIRNHLALVSYSSVGRQDLVFTSVGNGISSTCQLQSLIRCRFASPVTRRLPEAHPQALGEAVPHLLPLALELLPQGMNLPLLGFRGRRFDQFPLFMSHWRGQSLYRHVLQRKLPGHQFFLSLN